MRQSIRALGWTITIVVILIVLFLGSAMYSIFQTLMNQGFGFGSFQIYTREDGIVLSFPLYVNNTSYYDISTLNLTTFVRDFRGVEISKNSTTVDVIKAGAIIPTFKHNMSINSEILENLIYLLFEDGNLSIDTYVGIRYAYAFYFQMEMPNVSMPWGAPFYNLTIGELPSLPLPPSSFNGTHYLITIPLSFENHAFFNVTGAMRLEILNSTRNYLGSGTTFVNILPGSPYDPTPYNGVIEVSIPIENMLTDTGYLYIYFENSIFNFGTVEKTYG